MCLEEILSLVSIVVSSVIYSYSLQLKNKKNILIFQMIACVLYIASYVFALLISSSAKIGLITASFELLRLIVYYTIDSKERKNNKQISLIATIFFCVALTVSSVVAEPSGLCVLTLIGAIPVTIALASKNIIFIKVACIIQSVGICTYLCLMSLWFNAATQVGVFVSAIIGLIIYVIKINRERKSETKQ